MNHPLATLGKRGNSASAARADRPPPDLERRRRIPRSGSREDRQVRKEALRLLTKEQRKAVTALWPRVRDEEFERLADEVMDEGRTLQSQDLLWTLWQAAANTASLGLPGIEVGSWRGGSARFVAAAVRHHLGRELPFHVVDTFEGHPADSVSEVDGERHEAGLFADADYDDVKAYLSGHFDQVTVYEGDFESVAERIPDGPYGLAHVDVDLYRPVLAFLRHLGPRMAPGGVIVVDDFETRKCPGVRKAVDEYLGDGPPFQFWNPFNTQAVLVRRPEGAGAP